MPHAPELDLVARVMVSILTDLQREQLAEALDDPQQLLELLCLQVCPPPADLSEAVAAFRASLSSAPARATGRGAAGQAARLAQRVTA